MYEVVSPVVPEVGVFRATLLEARVLAEPGDQIWQVADDELRTRVCLIQAEPEPGTRVIDGRVFYSAAWL